MYDAILEMSMAMLQIVLNYAHRLLYCCSLPLPHASPCRRPSTWEAAFQVFDLVIKYNHLLC